MKPKLENVSMNKSNKWLKSTYITMNTLNCSIVLVFGIVAEKALLGDVTAGLVIVSLVVELVTDLLSCASLNLILVSLQSSFKQSCTFCLEDVVQPII